MLMALSHDDSPGATFWGALQDGVGRVFTREEAEAIAAQTSQPARFLFPFHGAE
jgi:hypothetical protein